MNGFLKNKKVFLSFIGLFIVIVSIVGISYSVSLENDVEVTPNSLLTYYLDVNYDGVDRNGVKSSDTTVASINSGYIDVTDKIPDGLTFEGFVTTSDGTIGAVKRDSDVGCVGKVIDDTHEEFNDHGVWNNDNTEYTYHGLHYNANTRTVSFRVNNLQAGCKLTVGIITRTPETIDDPNTVEVEKRRDFYNYAIAQENALTILSNTVHVFMGKDDLTMYNVSYNYTGTVPDNAPALPLTSNYIEGANVGVSMDPVLEGYTFSGWTTSDVTVTNGSFTMPASNVVLTGSFTEKTKYQVRYQLTGTTPDGYVLPSTKNYYQDAIVNVDSLAAGNIINGYRFLGWETEDATISGDRNFVMPNHDVTLVGRFELVTYTVTYAFYDTVLPPNHESLLPPSETHRPDEIVTLATINEPSGYRFLGWYKENNFMMPEENITIYGEWARQVGTFEPTITKEVTTTKGYYHKGDKVTFSITVTNTANFAIHDVIVKEDTENAKFVSGTGYEVQTDHYAKINSLAANASITLNAEYTVLESDSNKVVNTVEIVGALADGNYVLKDKEYVATAEFNIQSKITICKNISGSSVPNTFQFNISNNTYNTWITIKKDECDSVYVDPGTYNIKEIVPQEYSISSVSGAISQNNANLNVVQGNNYNITFTNRFNYRGFYHSFGRIENKIVTIA